MLDFGCGNGRQLAGFAQSHPHIDYTGYEPYMQIQTLCDAPIYKHLDKLKDKKFDVITALDVIEHIKDDLGALTKINDLLLPNGRLLITVPAHQGLYSSLDKIIGHYRRYAYKDLTKLVTAAGYEVVECFYLFPYLLIPYWCLHKCLIDILDILKIKYDLSFFQKTIPASTLKIPSMLAKLELTMIKKTKLRSPFGNHLFLHARKTNLIKKRSI